MCVEIGFCSDVVNPEIKLDKESLTFKVSFLSVLTNGGV